MSMTSVEYDAGAKIHGLALFHMNRVFNANEHNKQPHFSNTTYVQHVTKHDATHAYKDARNNHTHCHCPRKL